MIKPLRFAWVLGGLAIGCGGSSDIAIGDFTSQFVSAICDNAVECDNAPDVASCKAAINFQDSATLTLLADANPATKVKYDGGAAGECADQIRSRGCSFSGFRNDPTSSCAKIFTGTVATGGACFVSAECANSGSCTATMASCDPSTTCCPGTCTAAPVKATAGASCASAPCADNLYCSMKSMTCLAVVTASGSTCEGIDACANPLVCNLDFNTNTGTCGTPAATGATCDKAAFVPCADQRDYCDQTAAKCTRGAAVGSPCAGTAGITCLGDAQCVNSTCVALGKSGDTCTATMTGGSVCLEDLQCTTSKCALPAAGMACH